MPTYFFADGYPSRYVPTATGQVVGKGTGGNITAHASFSSSYELVTTTGVKVPVDESLFAVQLSNPGQTSMIDIQQNGNTLASIEPWSKIIEDAVSGINGASFSSDPKSQKLKLASAAKRFQGDLATCRRLSSSPSAIESKENCFDRAVRSLLNLRSAIDSIVREDLSNQSPSLRKTDILRAFEAAALYLIPDRYVPSQAPTVSANVVPINEASADDLMEAVSATQGSYGNVTIEKNGRVTYKSDGAPREDHFKVTLRSKSGLRAVKNVTVHPGGKK